MECFLIVPNVANHYDQRMVTGLAGGFKDLGHDAIAVATPLSSIELHDFCQKFHISVVLQVNRTRDPMMPLPKGTRHIAWYQDVFPDTHINFREKFHSDDILYTLGNRRNLGLDVNLPCFSGALYTGVSNDVFEFPTHGGYIAQDIDMTLCGSLPSPPQPSISFSMDFFWHINRIFAGLPFMSKSSLLWLIRKVLFGNRVQNHIPLTIYQSMTDAARKYYRPLKGELDINHLKAVLLDEIAPFVEYVSMHKINPRKDGRISKKLKPYCLSLRKRTDWISKLFRLLANDIHYNSDTVIPTMNELINYFSQSFPRIMDRELLVRLAGEVTPSFKLWGNGLATHEFALPYYMGSIENQNDLLFVYRRSKINLANNTHGLGLHSRNLECMAVGGFIFTHASSRDMDEGGIRTTFEPGVHYGEYTPENFHDEARRWLSDDKKRMEIGEAARKVVKEKHRWINRARQILEDLKR